MPPPAAPAPVQLFQMITGFAISRAIHVAARLDVAQHLAGGPLAIGPLAQRIGADPDALHRVLRALASVGVFTETSPRTFANTPMSDCLRSDVPHSQRASALMIGNLCYPAFGELAWSVRTGEPGFVKLHGAPFFDWLRGQPEHAREFDQAMAAIHGGETPAMIEAYPFAAFGTIVDVGGGNGTTLAGILRSAPKARGVVFDLPDVAARAAASLQAAGVADRCRIEGGSFFDAVPAGADAYLLRHVVHDWGDDDSVRILRRCRDAVAPGGKVLVVESVLPPGDEPHPGKWLDVIMLAVPGGRERTAAEYERLLAAAGLGLQRIVPTRSPVSVIEATPA